MHWEIKVIWMVFMAILAGIFFVAFITKYFKQASRLGDDGHVHPGTPRPSAAHSTPSPAILLAWKWMCVCGYMQHGGYQTISGLHCLSKNDSKVLQQKKPKFTDEEVIQPETRKQHPGNLTSGAHELRVYFWECLKRIPMQQNEKTTVLCDTPKIKAFLRKQLTHVFPRDRHYASRAIPNAAPKY